MGTNGTNAPPVYGNPEVEVENTSREDELATMSVNVYVKDNFPSHGEDTYLDAVEDGTNENDLFYFDPSDDISEENHLGKVLQGSFIEISLRQQQGEEDEL